MYEFRIPESDSDHEKATIKEINGCKTLRVYRFTLVENQDGNQLGEHPVYLSLPQKFLSGTPICQASLISINIKESPS